MVYTTRHAHIADIVFQRALPKPEDRYNQLIRVADGLNIDYSSDNIAYRYLFRARNIIELVTSTIFANAFLRTSRTKLETKRFSIIKLVSWR